MDYQNQQGSSPQTIVRPDKYPWVTKTSKGSSPQMIGHCDEPPWDTKTSKDPVTQRAICNHGWCTVASGDMQRRHRYVAGSYLSWRTPLLPSPRKACSQPGQCAHRWQEAYLPVCRFSGPEAPPGWTGPQLCQQALSATPTTPLGSHIHHPPSKQNTLMAPAGQQDCCIVLAQHAV